MCSWIVLLNDKKNQNKLDVSWHWLWKSGYSALCLLRWFLAKNLSQIHKFWEGHKNFSFVKFLLPSQNNISFNFVSRTSPENLTTHLSISLRFSAALCISARTDSKFRTFPFKLVTSDLAKWQSVCTFSRFSFRVAHSSLTPCNSTTFFCKSLLAIVNWVFFSMTLANWDSRSAQRADLYFKVFINSLKWKIKRIEHWRSDILRKTLVWFPLPKKCAVFYPKLCILNFPPFEHCSADRVSWL